jgi:hypothetical protein
MMISQHLQSSTKPRRIRAAFIAIGLDGRDDDHHVTRSDQGLIVGGSAETHAEIQETMLRMEEELERRGQNLGDLDPEELAELAWRIDSPELHGIALQLEAGISRQGLRFEEMTAEQLTALVVPAHFDIDDEDF